MRGSCVLRFDYLGYPAACRGHKTDGVSKGEKQYLFPLVDHGVSCPVVDQREELPLLPFGYPIGFVPAASRGVTQ